MSIFRSWLDNRRAKSAERRRKRQREDAAYAVQAMRAFIDGGGGPWDWDDFTSCPLSDPKLDSIRKRALALDLPLGPDERATLQRLAEEAEQLARD
jgi:hypothetical protein